MSGILNEAFTPCPPQSRSSGLSEYGGSESFNSFMDDDSAFDATAHIEFTTEVRASTLAGVRPRRANRPGNVVQIYEDTREKQSGPVERQIRPKLGLQASSDRKPSLLAQPAQRFRPKVNFAPTPPSRPVKPKTETQPRAQARDPRPSNGFPSASLATHKLPENNDHAKNLKQDVRRNTVYIPPDDTTVPSVFMGLFSPLKQPHGNAMLHVEGGTQVNTIESQIAKRQARKSVVASARRAPLQPCAKIAQEAALRVDIAGKNGGKENIPPGAIFEIDNKSETNYIVQPKPKRLSTVASKTARRTTAHQSDSSHATNFHVGAKTQSPKRSVLGEKQTNAHAQPPSLPLDITGRGKTQYPLRTASASLNARASVLSERLGHSQASRASKIGDCSKLKMLNNQYPLLKENISKPALYEEDWLTLQETVITQLINALFECSNRNSMVVDVNILRLELLEVYHADHFTHLYERLQSSLTCGTLSIPKDLQIRNSRLKHDLGLRREFFDIWIQTYDLRALVPALEVVVGRRIFADSRLSNLQSDPSLTNDSKTRKAMARKLESFLEVFLLHNEDMVHHAAGLAGVSREAHAKAYRRTVLRSVVLVILLDHARQSSSTALPRQLFLSSSPYKSSVEVLLALARLLLPSCGDFPKSLGHLGCHVAYRQHELQEYDYTIDNIAVDVRDGVRLTRIVEALFYTSDDARTGFGDQTEVTLPSGDALSLLGDERDLPLSKHLKYPCISRAAKIYNCQIALSALNSVKGGRAIVGDVRAEDIVDGYREKTIALLWALVSKWGLASLVDWEDARKEIGRLQSKAALQLGHDRVKDEDWFNQKATCNNSDHAALLQQWAAILAAMKGLEFSNLTTSFADGRIYESIVDEYESFITGKGRRDCGNADRHSASMSLESRLHLLGCSSQFGKSYKRTRGN